RDNFHVFNANIDVFSGDVAAAQAVNKTAEGFEKSFRLNLGVANNNRFAAAQVKTGDGSLISHAAREAENVVKSFFLTAVIPHSASAKRRAQGRIVYRYDCFQS